ncbi:hypothetical protein CBL_01818 [Carabus blaptoides fortunei]
MRPTSLDMVRSYSKRTSLTCETSIALSSPLHTGTTHREKNIAITLIDTLYVPTFSTEHSTSITVIVPGLGQAGMYRQRNQMRWNTIREKLKATPPSPPVLVNVPPYPEVPTLTGNDQDSVSPPSISLFRLPLSNTGTRYL